VPAAAIAAATTTLSDSEDWQKPIDPIHKSNVAIRFWVCLSVVFGGPDGEFLPFDTVCLRFWGEEGVVNGRIRR
jgi:hypothetical protein